MNQTPPEHQYTSTPEHQYTSTPVHQNTSTPVHQYRVISPEPDLGLNLGWPDSGPPVQSNIP